jgi:acyl-CoA dehydrogenase
MTTTAPEVDARELRDGVMAFIDAEVLTIQAEIEDILHDPRRYWREDGRLCDEVVDARRRARVASARAGYYTMFCPEELGGGGLGAGVYFTVWESICRRFGSPQTQLPFYVLAHTSTGPTALWLHASAELRATMLPRLLAGESQGAFAMSEPNAGSDAWGMQSTAVRDGDEWVLNGTKQWATWGPTADWIITFAIDDKERFAARRGGLTAFFVPTNSPGYRLDSIVGTYDELGGEECILSFNDVRIPDEYRLGPVGEGFAVAMQGSAGLKLTKVGRTVGLATWAYQKALEYSKVRRTFGKTLSEHQTVQNMLAESRIDIQIGRLFAKDVAAKLDNGAPVRGESAMMDAWVFEAMYRVYDRSVQILGGMGISNELRMTHGFHMLRTARFSEGPTEVQMRMVANHILRGNLDVEW